MTQKKRPPEASLLDAILFAPDRDRIPGARPVVAYGEGDPERMRQEIEPLVRSRVALSRRGLEHGLLAELDLTSYGLGERAPTAGPEELRRRWREARPVVLPGVAKPELSLYRAEIQRAFELFEALGDPGSLGAHVRACELPEGMACSERRAPLADAERDLEKLWFRALGAGTREARDLWVKSAYLSTHPDDASLRVRVSFGREGEDDASSDEWRHRLVALLGEALFPETGGIARNGAIREALETALREEALLTQPIAYWNAPEGGASFHHDALEPEGGRPQLGALYVQLAGRTAWLALSSADLAARVRDFVEGLAGPHSRALRAELCPREADFERLRERTRDPAALARELALPGCGALGAVANRGPEFTAFLADAGHAVLLDEGDAILLPNHGATHTAMHSVFCASEHATYSLSFGIRGARGESAPPPPEPALEARPGRDRLRRRSTRRAH